MKKFFTLIAAVMMAVGAMAQSTYTPSTSDKADTDIKVGDVMTIQFKNNTSKGSTAGAGSWTFNNGSATTDQNGLELSIKVTDNVVLSIYFNAKLANNKPICMYKGEEGIPCTIIDSGQKVECNKAAGVEIPAGGGVKYELAPGDYIFYANGTKWAFKSLSYTIGEAKKEAPQISLPSDLTAYVGATATLAPEFVSGSPAPDLQWYSNTSASNQGGTAIEGATSSSLSITPDAVGTLYYYAVATNSEGSKTSNCCTVTVIDPNIYVSEADEIYFNEIEEGNPNGLNFIGGALKLTVTSTEGKMVIASNGQNFGTPEESFKCEKRLDTGGKTVSSNKLVLNSTKAGKLYIYARADARQIVIKQDGATLLSQMLNESNATVVPKDDGSSSSYFPIYSVDVAAGDIDVEFPDGRIYIYGFSLDGLITSIENVNVAAPVAPAKKSLRNGQIVIETINGTFNAVGAQVK